MVKRHGNGGWLLCVCCFAGIVVAVFGQLQSLTLGVAALVAACWLSLLWQLRTRLAHGLLLLTLCAWTYTHWRLHLHTDQLPPPDAGKLVYLLQGKVRDCYDTRHGQAVLLDEIVVLRPQIESFRINRLRVYVPPLPQRPLQGSNFQAWVQLRYERMPQPIAWPMSSFRARYWPQIYGVVKTQALLQYQAAPAARPSRLSQGNRELRDALLRNQASHIWMERLQPFGLGHLLAVSGLHFGLFFVLLMFAFAPLRGQVTRWLVTVLGLLAFAWWMSWTASVSRACAMLLLWLLLPLLRRKRNRLRLWMGLLLGGLLIEPLALLQRGFWYTFAASGGLLLGYRARRITPLEHPWLRRMRPFLPIVAAQLIVMPVHLVFAVEARWDSLLWNLLAFPFLVVIGLQLSLVSLASAWEGLAPIANYSETLLLQMLDSLAQLPSLVIVRMPYDPLWAACLLTAAFALLALNLREWRWYACLALVLAGLSFGRPEPGPRWLMLDVAQGAAMLYVDQKGHGWLFDAGGKMPRGLSFQQLLKLYGVRQLQGVFISHCNQDHYNFLEDLPAALPIYIPHAQIEAFTALPPPLSQRRWVGLAQGDQLTTPDFEVEVLWPAVTSVGKDRNETGLVLAIRHPGGKSLLLMGDAGQQIEPLLQLEHAVDILQVGHHGSRTASHPAFIQRLQPHKAWISCGRNNRFGHPHEEVRNTLECAAVTVEITAESGTLIQQVESID